MVHQFGAQTASHSVKLLLGGMCILRFHCMWSPPTPPMVIVTQIWLHTLLNQCTYCLILSIGDPCYSGLCCGQVGTKIYRTPSVQSAQDI